MISYIYFAFLILINLGLGLLLHFGILTESWVIVIGFVIYVLWMYGLKS